MIADVLETERLLLGRWRAEDLDGFARLASDRRVLRHVRDGRPWSRRQVEERHRSQLDHWHRHGFGRRAAVEKASGQWIGFAGIGHPPVQAIQLDQEDVEIGFWLDPAFWGKGLATEAALALRDEAFEAVGVACLLGRHQPANSAAGRILEKLGMRFERDALGRHGDRVRVHGLDRARRRRVRQIDDLIARIREWGRGRDDVRGIALVGSWARGAGRLDSDLDLVLLTDWPSTYIESADWVRDLGATAIARTRQWGVLTERRLALPDALEVDVGVASPQWASTTPLDAGTRRVAAHGLVPLHDPDALLATLLEALHSG